MDRSPDPSDLVAAEVMDLCVSAVRLLGQPRTIGEIYGLLFLADAPLPMDEVVRRLRISKGSASQGLRRLREFGAVRVTYVEGDRRDHYVAETRMRQVVGGFLRGAVLPHLDAGSERLRRIETESRRAGVPRHLRDRVRQLRTWHSRAGQLLPLATKVLG